MSCIARSLSEVEQRTSASVKKTPWLLAEKAEAMSADDRATLAKQCGGRLTAAGSLERWMSR